MLWRIRLEDGRCFDLPTGETSIGRDEACTIRVPHRSISRRHVTLHVGVGEVAIEDHDSSNGTWIERARLRGRSIVRDGVELRLGDVTLILTPVADAPSRAPALPALSEERRRALELHVELVHRALAAGHFEHAEQSLADLGDDSSFSDIATPALWDALLRCAVSLAVATDDGRWLQWVFEHLADCPDPPLGVIRSVQLLPPSLLVRALPSFERLLALWRDHADELPRSVRDSVPPLSDLAARTRRLAPITVPPA